MVPCFISERGMPCTINERDVREKVRGNAAGDLLFGIPSKLTGSYVAAEAELIVNLRLLYLCSHDLDGVGSE